MYGATVGVDNANFPGSAGAGGGVVKGPGAQLEKAALRERARGRLEGKLLPGAETRVRGRGERGKRLSGFE